MNHSHSTCPPPSVKLPSTHLLNSQLSISYLATSPLLPVLLPNSHMSLSVVAGHLSPAQQSTYSILTSCFCAPLSVSHLFTFNLSTSCPPTARLSTSHLPTPYLTFSAHLLTCLPVQLPPAHYLFSCSSAHSPSLTCSLCICPPAPPALQTTASHSALWTAQGSRESNLTDDLAALKAPS